MLKCLKIVILHFCEESLFSFSEKRNNALQHKSLNNNKMHELPLCLHALSISGAQRLATSYELEKMIYGN